MLRFLTLIFIASLVFPLTKPSLQTVPKGTFFYILEKQKKTAESYNFFVEEIGVDTTEKRHFWLTFNSGHPSFEIYDNTWFDRFLKPTGNPNRATVGRLISDQSVQLDPNHYKRIKQRKNLYAFYPSNDEIPKTDLNAPIHATDFNKCIPSDKPPMHRSGKPCGDRGKAAQIPRFLWEIIEQALTEDKDLKKYYQAGLITPPMIAAAAHLETRFSPLLENQNEKELCLSGQCTPYKWGKGPGQIGDSESVRLWNMHWQPPSNHPEAFVRKFEQISKKLLGSCGYQEDISKKCHKRFKRHIANCRLYEKLTKGISHAFCFQPSFRMFAHKMKKAFSKKSVVWQQIPSSQGIKLKAKPIYQIIDEVAQGNRDLWFATSARLRAGYINRGAMVNLSLQECVNYPHSVECSYGNLSNQISRRPSSQSRLATPPKHLGAQILKGEFINRCHVWYFAGLCGPVRKGSLLDQYSRIYKAHHDEIPKVNPKAI